MTEKKTAETVSAEFTEGLIRQTVLKESLEELQAKTVKAGYKSTESRLFMEKEEAIQEEGTRGAIINQVLSKINKVLDYQDALVYEARALKAYADALEFFDGLNRAEMIKDLRACAAERLKTKRGLEVKKEEIRSRIYRKAEPQA